MAISIFGQEMLKRWHQAQGISADRVGRLAEFRGRHFIGRRIFPAAGREVGFSGWHWCGSDCAMIFASSALYWAGRLARLAERHFARDFGRQGPDYGLGAQAGRKAGFSRSGGDILMNF